MKVSLTSSLVILILGILLSSFLRFSVVWNNNFPFTIDQGRDMVDLRHMVVTVSPRLVGPTTSINGVLLGPSWYYFLLPAFLLGQGSPATLLYWQIIWYEIAGVVLWFVLSKRDIKLGLITALLFLFMPVGFNANRYFWNANAMLIFTAFFFSGLFWSQKKPTVKNLFVVGLLAGIAQQIEAAFGILFFPFALLFFILRKTKKKELTSLSLGYLVTLLPQILFEIRHQFIMTKVLLAEFSGGGEILGKKLVFAARLIERWSEFNLRIIQLSHVHPNIILFVFFAALILGVALFWKKSFSDKDSFSVSLLFIFAAAIFYLIFPQHLKTWYTLGLSIPFIVIVAYFINKLASLKAPFSFLAWLFVSLHIVFAVSAQLEYLTNFALRPSDDPSNLRNQLTAIDWVYRQANGKAFNAYTFIPGIYDYNYHYLYWWYGPLKYGYQPNEVAYLPDQTEYIQDNDRLWTRLKPADENIPTFLIVEDENNERFPGWSGHFVDLCKEKEMSFIFPLKAIELIPCK